MIMTNSSFFYSKNNIPSFRIESVTNYKARHYTLFNSKPNSLKSTKSKDFISHSKSKTTTTFKYDGNTTIYKSDKKLQTEPSQQKLKKFLNSTFREKQKKEQSSLEKYLQSLQYSDQLVKFEQKLHGSSDTKQQQNCSSDFRISPSQTNTKSKALFWRKSGLSSDFNTITNHIPQKKQSIQKRRSSLLSTQYLFDQLHLNKNRILDPKDFERMTKYLSFFQNLFRNIQELIKLEGKQRDIIKILSRLKGTTVQVLQYIMDMETKHFKFKNGTQMFEQFLRQFISIKFTSEVEDYVQEIQENQFYKKLQYFSQSLFEYLQKILYKKMKIDFESSYQLKNQILNNMKQNNQKQIDLKQSLRNKSQLFQFKPLTEQLEKLKNKHQDLYLISDMQQIQSKMLDQHELNLYDY